MQDSREYAGNCLNRLSAAIAELGRALTRDAQTYPNVYIAELENVSRRLGEAQEEIASAKADARRFVELQKRAAELVAADK